MNARGHQPITSRFRMLAYSRSTRTRPENSFYRTTYTVTVLLLCIPRMHGYLWSLTGLCQRNDCFDHAPDTEGDTFIGWRSYGVTHPYCCP